MKKMESFEIAEISVSYSPKVKVSDRPQVKSAEDAYRIFLETWDVSTLELFETAYMLVLNRANRVLGACLISQGGVSGTVIDPKIVFRRALKGNAVSVIIAHNHPSGNLKPSRADLDITQKLKKAGEFLEVAVLDHLILSPSGDYFSFSDEGLL